MKYKNSFDQAQDGPVNTTRNKIRKRFQTWEKDLSAGDEYTSLSSEDEAECARIIQKRGGSSTAKEQAVEKLVKHNIKYIKSVAKSIYFGLSPRARAGLAGLTESDLVSEGVLGANKAALRFDARGRFISYAVWWIRQAIFEAISEQMGIVRRPLNVVLENLRISRAVTEFMNKRGYEPSEEELADALNVSVEWISERLGKFTGIDVSLDAVIPGTNDLTLRETMKDEQEASPDLDITEKIDETALKEEITKQLAKLRPREAEILNRYFGLDGERPATLQELGEKFHLTRERIRQIKEKALLRMRHPSRRRPLENFTD